MAILNLKVFGVKISTDASEPDIILSTEEKLDEQGESQIVTKEVKLTNKDNADAIYNLSLVNLHLHKKMYQPTEIHAEISVVRKDLQSAWVPITRDTLDSVFKNKKVSLIDAQDVDLSNIPDYKKIGEDFYVHAVHVKYMSDYMRIILSIFSLDKQMTLLNTCRTFVCKKLKTDILETEISKFTAPYDENTKLTYDAASMKNLSYTSSGKNTEHIFPFLVQYNESFYDMLARTTNRWGEFMYYENGKLNVGYTQSTAIPVPTTINERNSQNKDPKLPVFNSLSYYDVDDQETGDDNYDCSASYDDNILSDPIRIDPEKISANFLTPWRDKYDKAVMKKFSSFFKNDKNLPTFLGNELFNDLYDLTKQGISVKSGNNDRENEFFTEEKKNKAPEQYAEYNFGDDKDKDNAMGFNPFSEINSDYDKKKYFGILTNEINAGKNAICINFDTSYPCLKLGQIISVYGNEYIVTQIDCTTNVPLNPKNNLWSVSTEKAVYSFQVYALAKQGTQFYPTVIPAGHVRLADPQIATVTDASDPNGNGRVRVMFSWQTIVKDDDKNITDETKEASSPWLQFTANAGGKKGIMGMHYENDKVFVGFVDGNVERPYVIGAISKGAGADIHCTTAGNHQLKIFDDEAGITAFMTGMFLPVWGTFSDFIPGMGDVNPSSGDKNNLALAGGFELSDNYGIYKITGSTDGREVSIASPWGEVNIGAFTGINISAPNGDISIKGKNVSIEAGNNLELISGKNVNYKLWKEKTTKLGTLQYVLLDVAAAVAKKLTEMVVNIIDLSIIRSVVEIVMRPVEGSLTVKSNRYLKLEAGKNECDYPAEGYSDFRTQSSYLKFKDKFNAKRSAGFYSIIPNSNMGSSMEELFKKISNLVDDLDKKYKTIYNECVTLKGQLETCYTDLDKYVNTTGKKSYDADTLDELYKEKLKADLWKAGKFESFTEDNLKLSGEVKVDDNATVTNACFTRNQDIFPQNASNDDKKKIIIQKRKEKRAAALEKLNALRREICKLLNLELDASDIGKTLSWFLGSAAPQDFKKNMNTSFSRSKCKDSRYYKFTDNDPRKNLASQIQTDKALSVNDIKYMKRLVALNLLDEFGFTNDDLRKKVNNVLPPIPETEPYASTEDGHIMNDQSWSNFVTSLNGIPSIERDTSLIANAIEDAAKSAWDNINVWDGIFEKLSWGEGKKGQILFGADGNTYALKDKNFSEIVPLSPKVTSLLENDNDLSSEDKQIVTNFLNKIRTVLNGY